MCENEILEDIHRIREEHAKSFNYDLDAMFEDLQKRQYEDGRQVVNLSQKPRTREPQHTTIQKPVN